MDCKEYIEQMKKIQKNLLSFIDSDNDTEECYQTLISFLKDSKIQDNKNDLESFINLIINVANNHYRSPNFFGKIERILLHFKEQIKKNYSNFEIFLFFKKNKRLLLFLLHEKMMVIDKQISNIMKEENYRQMHYNRYFQPELKPFIQYEIEEEEEEEEEENLQDDFEEKRQIGENDSLICQLIRNDSIDKFISHVNQHSISVNSIVNDSIYETNHMLLSTGSSLIEYAAFFGSIQIFKYLQKNGADVFSNLWLYAIHGNEPEIIHILEEVGEELKKHSFLSEDVDNLYSLENSEDDDENKKIKEKVNDSEENEEEEESEYDSESAMNFADSSDVEFDDYNPALTMFLTYKNCLTEAIKCHHNEIAYYIMDNYIEDKIIQYNNKNSFHRSVNAYSFCYSNFEFFPENLNQKFIIFYACRYDYYTIVSNLLKNKKIELQMKIILEHIYFLMKFLFY